MVSPELVPSCLFRLRFFTDEVLVSGLHICRFWNVDPPPGLAICI